MPRKREIVVSLKSKDSEESEQDHHSLLTGIVDTVECSSGPSCSKLTTSLVNDSLKFTSSDTRIC